jgi:uncharacterized membrane protein
VIASLLLALVVGVIAGLRTFAAPTAVSVAARLGKLDLGGSWFAFLGFTWTPLIFIVLAIVELITDQLPTTPSRTVPMQFSARILAGAFSGAAIGLPHQSTIAGLVTGVIGAVIGTLGGRAFRARLASTFGRDRPAAFIEDAVAYAGALIVVLALS